MEVDPVPAFITGGITAGIFGVLLRQSVYEDSILVSAFIGLLVGVCGYAFVQWLRWEIIRKLLTYRNWMYDHKSSKTKAWGILLSFLIPKRNKLFALQSYLPRHPLPKLEDTCKKTLKMVRPLLSDKDYDLVVEATKEFQQNEGPKLQSILQKRYETEENWLIDLWDKYVYLAGRKPIPVHSNFCTLGDIKHKENFPVTSQLSQAANSMHYFMEYKEKIESGSIRNMMIQNIVPICCDRYKYICSTTRIPKEGMDELVRYPGARHVVVFRKGSMYKVDLYAKDARGEDSILSPREIQDQLQQLMDDAEKKEAGSTTPIINPSIFTATDRTKWAQIHEEMLEAGLNATNLEIVENAAFCVALDTDNPKDHSEEFHCYLTGNGFNRWFDKSLTLIVENNCMLGLNVEHTSAEATLSGRMVEYAFFHSKFDENGNAKRPGYPSHNQIPEPQHLTWDLKKFEDEIKTIKEDWDKLANDVDALVYYLDKGKHFMKKLRLSPDGYMQMALQLAFYRLHKETPKTYETAATRLFKLGRTETIRPVSEHSVAFTKAFDDPSVPNNVKISHLKEAISYQTLYKFDATNGRAVDRHLLGLYVAGKMCGIVPKLFTLKPFTESDRLSTSQSPLKYGPDIMKYLITDPVGGGFGAQHPEGYGVSYFMKEHKVHFLITSFKNCPDTGSLIFANAIQKAVDDIKDLLDGASQPKKLDVNGS